MLVNRTELLRLLQSEFPLTSQPWKELGRVFFVDSEDILKKVQGLKREGAIRRIAGIFDLQMLGYESALIAVGVSQDKVESAGYVISADPRVSHCYQRSDNDFPLWFTFAVKDVSLEEQADELARKAGAERFLVLPCERKFKLGVTIDPHNGKITSSVNHNHTTAVMVLSQEYRNVIRVLQNDLPEVPKPFAELADEVSLSEHRLLDIAGKMLESGIMRRYGAVLHHSNLGLTANVMAVWDVDEDEDEVLQEVAGMHMISHCYLRPRGQGWPYNFYTMIHCRTRQDALQATADIATVLNNSRYRLLWTLREFKKIPIVY